jgi:hypothetical protein
MTRDKSSWRAISVACNPEAPPNDPVDAAGRGEPVDPELGRDTVNRSFGRRSVETAPAAEKARRIEIAEHEIGVGNGRSGAAGAVAGGSRDGAGALRTDMQDAAGVDPGDRAAARPDTGDVEAVQRDRVPGDAAAGDEGRVAADDQRDVGAGAAHVERDQTLFFHEARGMDAAGYAAGRARQHGSGRHAPGLGDRHDAAVRLNDQGRPAVAGFREPLLEPRQIAREGWADIGVDDRCRDPLVFLDLRQHLGRQRDVGAGEFPFDRRLGRELMTRVAVGVEVADRDSLNLFPFQRIERVVERGPVQRDLDTAVGAQPLAHAEPQLA